jgi:uncharacterized protein (TIGR03382 family)
MLRALIAAMTFGVASSWVSPAGAEEEFPGALTDAADMECVPTCLMCHTVNPGTASSWARKPLGIALGAPITAAKQSGADAVEAFNTAWASYAAANAENVALIKRGIEPGAMQDVCGPKYGCGATFAPSRGVSGSSATIVAALSLAAGLWVMRRRR